MILFVHSSICQLSTPAARLHTITSSPPHSGQKQLPLDTDMQHDAADSATYPHPSVRFARLQFIPSHTSAIWQSAVMWRSANWSCKFNCRPPGIILQRLHQPLCWGHTACVQDICSSANTLPILFALYPATFHKLVAAAAS